MTQNTNVSLPTVRYTRSDFAALRAYMNRLKLVDILNRYYCDDDRELLHLETQGDLRERLDGMVDFLTQRAADTNPHVAPFLRTARTTSVWSKRAIDYLVKAADLDMSSPRPDDPLSFWFLSIVSNRLRDEGCKTIEDLARLINWRGIGWYKPIPGFGKGRAAAIVGWLREHDRVRHLIEDNALVPLVAPETTVLDPFFPKLVPFERMALPLQYSGQNGTLRCPTYRLIEADNDKDAIEAFLLKHGDTVSTRRAYRKELERYLLWCILCRRKPLSSVTVEDCEAYKLFLSDPDSMWIGDKRPHFKAPRFSPNWRPFAGVPSAASRRYAVVCIRMLYSYLVDVRYLVGNPWKAVKDPKAVRRINTMQIEKALPVQLWAKISAPGGVLDSLCDTPDEILKQRYRHKGEYKSIAAQFRIARAALLLMGESGMRRQEVASATYESLRRAPESTSGLWELTFVGKRSTERTVFFPERVVAALHAHLQDRLIAPSQVTPNTPLLAPVAFLPTTTTKKRHGIPKKQTAQSNAGYSADALGRLISRSLSRMATDPALDLTEDDSKRLSDATGHALRHTFGTKSVADKRPLDVIQLLMGHKSLETTTQYVQAPRNRAISEMDKPAGG